MNFTGLHSLAMMIVAFAAGIAVPYSLQADLVTKYNLVADWSDTANPNGVWSYNDGNGSIANHVSNYVPTNFPTAQPAWALAESGPGHIVSWLRTYPKTPARLNV